MKCLFTPLLYLMIPALGLIWAIGCSTTPTGARASYTMELSTDSDTLQNGGKDTVRCFLKGPDGNPYVGGNLKFSTRSENPAQSTITPSTSSATTSTGTDPPVLYNPINIDTTFDVIYAAFVNATYTDTITWDSTTVVILQP